MNGEDLRNIEHHSAVSVLKDAGQVLQLVVHRALAPAKQKEVSDVIWFCIRRWQMQQSYSSSSGRGFRVMGKRV